MEKEGWGRGLALALDMTSGLVLEAPGGVMDFRSGKGRRHEPRGCRDGRGTGAATGAATGRDPAA